MTVFQFSSISDRFSAALSDAIDENQIRQMLNKNFHRITLHVRGTASVDENGKRQR